MLSFQNTQIAFKHKSDAELSRAKFLFSLMGYPFLVKKGPTLVNKALNWGLPVKSILKATLFKQFCGGETLNESVKTSQKLNKYNVKTILDYSVEGENNEKAFDACRDEIIKTLEHSSHHREVIFSACKVSGLGNTALLTKIQSGAEISNTERDEESRIIKRMEAIAFAAVRNRTPVFFDAEESWFQQWIDLQTERLMERHNQETPWIYTTLQLYRHDRLQYLKDLHQSALQKSYIPGVKLVRGAYLEKETQRSVELQYPNPMQPDKASTDRDFDAACAYCLDHIDTIALCAGTHNEYSSLRITQIMEEKQIPVNHPNICFAQLLGMSDHISYNLAAAGYTTAKYLPYGPVEAVMPYLFRRAEENSSVAGQTGRELDLIKKELKRRG
jgi:proline dehydrogenase